MTSDDPREFVRVPRPLGPGSRIVVVAPSSPVPPALEPRLELVLGHLRSRGFEVIESSCLRARATPSAGERAAAWMEALLGEDHDAVFPPWGGDLALEVLARMDFTRLRCARPKWLLGYSDISTLLVPLLLELGWASAHGPNLMDLVPAQTDPLTSGCLSLLASHEPVSQRSSTHFQTAWVDWERRPGAPFHLDQPTRVRTLDGRPARASGRLVGGCIDTLVNLVGTPFGDVARFAREHAPDGTLVFLENCELTPGQLARALTQIRLAGWLDGARAVLFGRSSAKQTGSSAHEDIVRRVLGDLAIPVALDLDIGHLPPQWTLVEGALASLEVEDGQASLHLALGRS